MLYDEKAVRDNLRNREGKRVFYLGSGDQLTPSARDFLTRERIAILPADQAKPERYKLEGGGYLEEKPEHMTHLNGEYLVRKDHPRIRFRGAVDSLEAELLLAQQQCPELHKPLGEILALARRLIRCDVLEEAVEEFTLGGLTEAEQRQHSHFPQKYYGKPHFMPEASDGPAVLVLNRCRTAARAAELQAVTAFGDTRQDIVKALNRMSSMLYILMLREKCTKSDLSAVGAGRIEN